MVAGVRNESGFFNTAECAGRVTKGFNQDTENITKLFTPHMEMMDPDKIRCVNFPISSPISYVRILGLTNMYFTGRPLSRNMVTSCVSNFLELHLFVAQSMLCRYFLTIFF